MPVSRRSASRRAALLAAAVLHGVLVAGATAAFRGLGEHERWDWGEFLGRAATFAVALWLVTALQKPAQRFFGPGTPRQQQRRAADRAVARAVWEGVLPSDVDPVEWRQEVDRWVRQGQYFRVFYAAVTGGVGGLLALTAVRVDSGDRGVLALAAVLVAAGPALLVATRGPVARARLLRDAQLPVA